MSIKELRVLTGLTQKEFGEYLNIPIGTIRDWEQERSIPPSYVVELIEYRLDKENVIMLNKKWSELSEEKKEELLDESYPIDGITGNKPKESGECIVDFANGYSVAGHVEITDIEDVLTIDDDAVIYKSDN